MHVFIHHKYKHWSFIVDRNHQLNADKTQFIWRGTSHFLGKRDMAWVNAILPSTDVVNNLGSASTLKVLMERQVSRLCQVCYFHLRLLQTVCRSLTIESLLTLIYARGIYVTRLLFFSGWDGTRVAWWSCAVWWACLLADNLCGLPLMVTLQFQDTDSKGQAFTVSGPQIWNSLPVNIRPSSKTLMLFKK